MNILDLQRSLAALEKRYNVLLETSEAQTSATRAQVEEAQNSIKELKHQLNAKEVELESEKKESAALQIELSKAKEELSKTKEELSKTKGELVARSEEVELTLLQLHQVQEELDHYFHQSRGKDALLKKHKNLQQRVKLLASKLLNRE